MVWLLLLEYNLHMKNIDRINKIKQAGLPNAGIVEYVIARSGSDEAISFIRIVDCFASLAMTG